LLPKNSRVHQNFNSQSGSSFGSVEVHRFTFSSTPRNMKYDSWASLLARAFVSHCFSCEPKAKVATMKTRGLKKNGVKGSSLEAKLWGFVKLGDRMGLVNQVGVVNQGRGFRWGHRNPKTRWLKRIEDCVAFNSLHLFNAYLQTFITPSTR
jgi:hypothetical protein